MENKEKHFRETEVFFSVVRNSNQTDELCKEANGIVNQT